jgi:hypothetical protein
VTIRNVTITVDREEKAVPPGLKQGSELLSACGVAAPEQLLLEIKGDIDVPVGRDDFILITGGEIFSIGDGKPALDDNPALRHPIRCGFNDQALSESAALRHPKITGAELKKLDATAVAGSRLIADLDGFADELIGDDQRLIVKPSDQFVVIPPSDNPVAVHEVEVHIDGRQVKLGAGKYVVSVLKQKLGVPAEYELERVKHGLFDPLPDDSVFRIHGGEEFVSHVRTGSSS